MAKELLKTPVGEVRWCKLVGPARTNKFDPEKRPSWTCDFLLDASSKEAMAWLQQMDDKFLELHPTGRAHNHGFPWKEGTGDDAGKVIVKFKLPEFARKDGTTSEPPTLFDAAKKPWPAGKEIGNGSRMVIGFDIYAWKGSAGNGMTFQPKAGQVIELVEYVGAKSPEELFDVVPSGYKADESMSWD
jgi:hypothetical protein